MAKNLLLAFSHFVLFPVSFRKIAEKMDEISRKYEQINTDFQGIIIPSDCKMKSIFPKEIFSDVVTLPFEDKEVLAIKNYDAFMRGWYGDYMQLPPVDKRITHHRFKAWWKE